MAAFTNYFSFEFKTGLRNPSLMLMNYLLPLGFYAMMGAVMVKINPGFGDILIPAMIVFTAMSTALLGMPGPMVEQRDAGVYRSFKINGVPALSILMIPVLTTIFHSLIVSAVEQFGTDVIKKSATLQKGIAGCVIRRLKKQTKP